MNPSDLWLDAVGLRRPDKFLIPCRVPRASPQRAEAVTCLRESNRCEAAVGFLWGVVFNVEDLGAFWFTDLGVELPGLGSR